MAIVSQPLHTPEWIFPTITNNHEVRLVGKKRGLDAEWEREKQEQMNFRGISKKAKMAEPHTSALNASNTTNDACTDMGTLADARAPHEFLAGAGDWSFEPLCSDTTPIQSDTQLEDHTPSEHVDVDKVIAILLHALNSQNPEPEHDLPATPTYQRPPTSPLAGSSNRAPFVRKVVGGSCRGKVDSGLQRWVLCKNHYDDIRSFHPSHRSSEWIETLHEMGWENLHPTYMSHSQQTFKTLNAFSQSWDDWIDIEPGEAHSGCGSEIREDGNKDMVWVPEDVWHLGVPDPQRTTPLMA